MDNGAKSYRRFREEGDENGLVEIIRDYKDGLIFYMNSFVGNIHLAEELAKDTFVMLAQRNRMTRAPEHFGHGFILSAIKNENAVFIPQHEAISKRTGCDLRSQPVCFKYFPKLHYIIRGDRGQRKIVQYKNQITAEVQRNAENHARVVRQSEHIF